MATAQTAAQSSSNSGPNEPDASLVGAHCSFEFCRQLDLLPFACPSCHGIFCRDHRIESNHSCPHAGAWAASRRAAELSRVSVGAAKAAAAPPPPPPGPCAAPDCGAIVRKPLSPATTCSRCRRDFCMRHRLYEDHDCLPVPSRQPTAADSSTTRARAALDRLRAWGSAARNSAGRKPAVVASSSSSLLVLQKASHGDQRVPLPQRVYVHVEASSGEPLATTTNIASQSARAKLYFNAGWTVGRVLDAAAHEMEVENANNTTADEKNRLRIFHIESGRVLHFTELFGRAVSSGDTIVLLRGIGAPPAPAEA